MKKNTILYIIITILLIIIAVGVTYIIMDNQDKEEVVEPSNNEEQGNNNDTNQTDQEEQITLTEEELIEYLSYVPINAEKELFTTPVNNMPNQILLGRLLYNMSDSIGEGEVVATSEEANQKMLEMYNQELDNYENSHDEEGNWLNYSAMFGGFCYTLEDNRFNLNYCASGIDFIEIVDDYEANEEELIIYSYVVYYNGLYGSDEIEDIYSGNTVNIELPSDGYQTEDNVKEYVNSHKNEFTRLKNTYKKNDTGYYWYSTGVEG